MYQRKHESGQTGKDQSQNIRNTETLCDNQVQGVPLTMSSPFHVLKQFKCIQNSKEFFCTLIIQIISMKMKVTSYN